MDRDSINDTLYLGFGTPKNWSPHPSTPFYPGDAIAFQDVKYDTDKANALLDGLGLTAKDSDGFRLMANGDRLDLKITTYAYADNDEMIANYWNAVGVHTEVDLISRGLCDTRKPGNGNMITGQGSQTLAQFSNPAFISPWAVTGCDAFGGAEYGRWNATGGAEGMEPPAEIAQLLQLVKDGIAGTSDDRDRLGKEIGRMHAEYQWVISPVAAVPNPFIVSNRLGNVAEVAASVWQIRTPSNLFPEVFFFRN